MNGRPSRILVFRYPTKAGRIIETSQDVELCLRFLDRHIDDIATAVERPIAGAGVNEIGRTLDGFRGRAIGQRVDRRSKRRCHDFEGRVCAGRWRIKV